MQTAPSASPTIIDVHEENFSEVLQGSMHTPVVLAFWSTSGQAGATSTATLEELTQEAKGAFTLAKLNVEANAMLAQSLLQQLGMRSVPHAIAFSQGRPVSQLPDALPKDQSKEWLSSFLPPETFAIDLMTQGREALAQGDTAAAIGAFNLQLQREPGHSDASIELARLALQQQDKAGTEALLSKLDEATLTPSQRHDVHALRFLLELDPPERSREELDAQIADNSLDYEARHELAMLHLVEGDMEAALDALLAIVIRDRDWEDDKARKTMVKIFEVMGLQSPETRTWQKKLGRAMY